MSKGAGLDLGHSQVRLAQVKRGKGGVVLTRYHSVAPETGESPVDNAAASFASVGRKLVGVQTGLTGSDLMLRYLPVPAVEDWRLERLMEFEVRELESRSGSPLADSYNLLPVPNDLDDEDTMILALVREDLLGGWMEELGAIPIQGFTPNAVALYNAYLELGDHEPSVTLLAHLGAGTLDMALVRGSDLYFARSVTTSLEQRDSTLASALGTNPAKARQLIHKHLDLRGGIGASLDSDADRVTRPILPLYDQLPTLLSGMLTLCRAQARLSELHLDRVLLTGGGGRANGLSEFLTERMSVPVQIWNPAKMVDTSGLDPEQEGQLLDDGPGSAVALGLALSAASDELYALEVLPAAARKKRDFRERGVFSVAAAVLAGCFLVADFIISSGRTADSVDDARRLNRQAKDAETSHRKAVELLDQAGFEASVVEDLESRYGVRRSGEEVLGLLISELPDTLWVESFTLSMQPGDEWGIPGRAVPVVKVTGRGEDGSRTASSVFAEFGGRMKALLPGGEEAARTTARVAGRDLEWTVEAHLLQPPEAEEEEA
jgi:Tfp pilus assembly PilM family ATPase